jgi:signal transduction histidine kinase
MKGSSSLSDIFGFGVIYIIIALVSWLYNQQMEQSLHRARRSEKALQKQKDSLEETVKERTRQLEAAQFEQLQQVYRFAELGRISSALFHDLANHLSSVSLDIEGLGATEKSALMQQVQHDIGYIDDIVKRVRLQLRGQGSIEQFDVIQQIKIVAKTLNYKMVQSGITFKLQAPSHKVYFTGDVIPFRQVISNLLGNAVEAYANSTVKKAEIVVNLVTLGQAIIITVQDWGKGIKPAQQKKIFEPFYSSKHDGTGIGLFIVKQIVEHDLGGSIQLSSEHHQGTRFTVTLRQSRGRRHTA